MKRFKKGTAARELIDELATVLGEDDVIEYATISKAKDPELRYTFGPVYSPGVLDAHDEFSDTEELRKALWNFAESSDRRLRKQHGTEVVGKIVEQVQWPFDLETELTTHTGEMRKVKLPAGTVYLGVNWTPDAWEDVKKGRIRGYSMGGAAVRLRDAAEAADLMKFA